MKPGPIIAMILLPLLGLWLIWNRPNPVGNTPLRANAEVQHVRIGNSSGLIEVVLEPDGSNSFRFLLDEQPSPVLNDEAIKNLLGDRVHAQLISGPTNPLFRLFNIANWGSMIWVVVGLGGQAVFMSRFLIQWIVSERKRESVVPPVFWWISLVGAIFLFAYFIWRRDIVGVLGQSTGVVIYARNLRLIHKQTKRLARTDAVAPEGSEHGLDPASDTKKPGP